MKKLILIRHAKSDWGGWDSSSSSKSDIERPLSKRGKRACDKISDLFTQRQLRVDLVEYSPAQRATETFDLIKDSISFLSQKNNSELYTFNSDKLKCIIASKSDEINNFLLIGHNPAIEALVIELVSANYNLKELEILRNKYPTGAIAFIELNILHWRDLHKNCGRLIEFVRPKDMEILKDIQNK